jgi:hypothetical protein
MPLILSGNVASATAAAYSVDNSCRFNDDDSAYMHKTPSSSGSQRTFTFSTWWKQGDLASTSIIFSSGGGGPNFAIYYDGSQQFNVLYYEGSTLLQLITNAVYRDPSAWYHICVAIDTTQSTDTNRAKIYINGSQVTSLATETYCNQNVDISINTSSYRMAIGAGVSDGDIADGYAAETVLIDGQQLTPTSFGEFDSASPTIWKPIDVSGLTFGTNGFYLDFEASDNLGNDANGGTDLTEVNLAATDQATDTPTNNFCTFNPLDVTADDEATLSEGNLKAVADGAHHQTRSTFYLTSGKWFWEYKPTTVNDDMQGGVVGSNYAGGSGLRRNYSFNGKKYTDGSSSSYGDTYVADDIIGVALNLDDGELKFYKNGTVQNSGTAAYTDMLSAMGGDGWTPDTITYNSTVEMNFGGGTPSAISSGNADANGYGNFEYAVPSGYYALCTKNLAEYG